MGAWQLLALRFHLFICLSLSCLPPDYCLSPCCHALRRCSSTVRTLCSRREKWRHYPPAVSTRKPYDKYFQLTRGNQKPWVRHRWKSSWYHEFVIHFIQFLSAHTREACRSKCFNSERGSNLLRPKKDKIGKSSELSFMCICYSWNLRKRILVENLLPGIQFWSRTYKVTKRLRSSGWHHFRQGPCVPLRRYWFISYHTDGSWA